MTKIIRENKDYVLTVGISVANGEKCYQILNKEYGIVEIETTILPQAIKFFGDVVAGLDAVLDMESSNNKLDPRLSKGIIGLN